MKTTQEIITDGLAKYGVPVLLIGGMALPAFDVVRQTIDVDCLISNNKADVLHKILLEAGYKEMGRTENFVSYSSESIYHYDIDLLLIDEDTFSTIFKNSTQFSIGNTVMNIPCVSHMIMLKLHAIKNNNKRELKDISDIVDIIHNNSTEIMIDELKELCIRYGSDGIYKKLEDLL
jgi:hypothetical protein